PLRAVFRTSLHPSLNTYRVEGPPDDVITHTRKILDPAAPNQDQRVLLKVVTDAGNIGGHLNAVGQSHAGDLPQRRIGLLRRLRKHANADTPLLRAVLQRRALGLADDLSTSLAD